MTQAAEALTAGRASESKLVAGVCFAHLVSHYYMLTLAPLFAFIRADFGVTYTELSLALIAFNVVSAVSQTPVGFFVDRTGPRINLIGGLLLGSAAIAIAGAAGCSSRCSPSWASPTRSIIPLTMRSFPSACRRGA